MAALMPGRRTRDFVVDPGALGARVRRIRTDRGLTRAGVAGVHAETIRSIENGTALPSLDTAIRLAAAFRVTLDDLVGPARVTASQGCETAAHDAPGVVRGHLRDNARATTPGAVNTSRAVNSAAAAGL